MRLIYIFFILCSLNIKSTAQVFITDKEDLKQVNNCINRNICSRRIPIAFDQNKNRAFRQEADLVLKQCIKTYYPTLNATVMSTKYKADEHLIKINYWYFNSNNEIQNSLIISSCNSIEFSARTCCADSKKFLELKSIAQEPIIGQTLKDVHCTESIDIPKTNKESIHDLTKSNFGFGFKKIGNSCQRICQSGKTLVLDRVSPELANPAAMISIKQQFRSIQNPSTEISSSTDDMFQVENNQKYKPECISCPPGTVTKENRNGCFSTIHDECPIGSEKIDSKNTPNYSARYSEFNSRQELPANIVRCAQPCLSGYRRNEYGLCLIEPKKDKEFVDSRLAKFKAWDPEKELLGLSFGACESSELIKIAKDYQKRNLTIFSQPPDSDERGGYVPHSSNYTFSESFGEYLIRSLPIKCSIRSKFDPEEIAFKDPTFVDLDSVPDKFWKVLEFGQSDSNSANGLDSSKARFTGFSPVEFTSQ